MTSPTRRAVSGWRWFLLARGLSRRLEYIVRLSPRLQRRPPSAAPTPRCGTMPEPLAPAPATADRNLLFGILALQMDFIGRDALVAAMHAWVLDKHKPLGQLLVKHGALTADTCALLEALVQKHLALHGDDAERSLAAVSSAGPIRAD